MSRLCVLSLSIIAVFWWSASAAQAGRRMLVVPIIWGYGEQFTDLGELPPDVSESVDEELGNHMTVAFIHNRAHVFWLDVWTWNGRYVLRSGDMYVKPDSSQWRKMIGGDPTDIYGRPLLYRFPSLLALLTAVAGIYVAGRFVKTEEQKLKGLLDDERYQRAIHILFGDSAKELGKCLSPPEDLRFHRARQLLMDEGISVRVAEANLSKVIKEILATHLIEIEGNLRLACYLAEQGDYDRSASLFEGLISVLPESDQRHAMAKAGLSKVQEMKNTTEASEEDPGNAASSSGFSQ